MKYDTKNQPSDTRYLLPAGPLQLDEQMFHAIFSTTYEFIIFLSPLGILLKANQAYLSFIQAKESEVIGLPFWDTPFCKYSPHTQKKMKLFIKKAQKGQLVRATVEYVSADGKKRPIDFSIEPIKNDAGDVMLLVVEGRDISKHKRLDDLRKEFLSATAHELKTPITVLKLLIQAHLRKAKEADTVVMKKHELELLDAQLNQLTQLINDMVDSSRFETGKFSLHFEIVDLTTLLKKILKKIQVYEKNHKIVVKDLPKNLIVVADPLRIEQVVLNLLSNASKYSPEGTTITISAQSNHEAIVSVQDQGIGIEKSKQRLIFDRYYQVKTKTKTGFGLGLYISKEIIRRHKGRIWVHSEKGKGSTFYFSLPLANGIS